MIYLWGVLGVILILTLFNYLRVKHRLKKSIQNDERYRFLETDKDIYDGVDCRCTDHYIITKAGFKHVICYEDILWVYIYEQQLVTTRTFGLTMFVYLKDGTNVKIMNSSGNGRKIMRSFNTVLDLIKEKSPGVIVGKTDENQTLYYSKLKELKK